MREHIAEASPESADTPAGPPWPPLARVLFRFVFCVVALYALDVVAGFFQRQTRLLDGAYPEPFPVPFTAPIWYHVVPWIGAHLLHLSQPVDPSYQVGQDSVYEYILRGTELVVAAVVTAV